MSSPPTVVCIYMMNAVIVILILILMFYLAAFSVQTFGKLSLKRLSDVGGAPSSAFY